MEQIRSFIAIELPDGAKKMLRQLQSQLKTGGQFPVKWVDPESIHLTLKFLGNVSSDTIETITNEIEESARGIAPFQLEVKGLGVFPNPHRTQVIWVGVSGELETLSRLQQRIESRLAPLGFPPEARKFTAHLTLGRVRERATPQERQSLGQLITATGFESGFSFSVDSVQLMRSQLTSAGAIYSRISSARLK